MKVVSPFRPFPPESSAHQRLGPFDWLGALDMLRASVRAWWQCDTYVLTDRQTTVFGPCYRYETPAQRLMWWLLEIVLAYVASDDFNEDTVLISPDALVVGPAPEWFRADLGVMVRPGDKYRNKPLLNGVQCWRVEAKDRLVRFYETVLARAYAAHPDLVRWGADTEPIVDHLAPLNVGAMTRGELSVYGFPAVSYFRALSETDVMRLRRGIRPSPDVVIQDFKSTRKHQMAWAFEQLQGAVAC